jgi:azurin
MTKLKTIMNFIKTNLRNLMLVVIASFLTVNVSFAASAQLSADTINQLREMSIETATNIQHINENALNNIRAKNLEAAERIRNIKNQTENNIKETNIEATETIRNIMNQAENNIKEINIGAAENIRNIRTEIEQEIKSIQENAQYEIQRVNQETAQQLQNLDTKPRETSTETTLQIESTDSMQYDNLEKKNGVNTFTVSAGSNVTLTLKHTGKHPKEAMGHNLVIWGEQITNEEILGLFNSKNKMPDEKPDELIDSIYDELYEVTEKIRNGGDNLNSGEFNNIETKEMLLAYTKMIGGGEQDTITFTAPKTRGYYYFFCSYPGHYSMMYGVMIVEN